MLSFIVGVLTGAIGTSVLYAALGEVISERAGVINLGERAPMLMGPRRLCRHAPNRKPLSRLARGDAGRRAL